MLNYEKELKELYETAKGQGDVSIALEILILLKELS